MKTSKKMFDEIGYIEVRENFWQKVKGDVVTNIVFQLPEKCVQVNSFHSDYIEDKSGRVVHPLRPVHLSMQELKAIIQQYKEFGWL